MVGGVGGGRWEAAGGELERWLKIMAVLILDLLNVKWGRGQWTKSWFRL